MGMQSDNAMNIGLDLPETGVDLAKLVYDVAESCNEHGFSRKIDLSQFKDDIMIELDIMKVKHENSHLPEAEVQKMVNTILEEDKQRKEKLAAEIAEKRDIIKTFIHGDSKEGYELAYRLCKDDDSDNACWLKYRLSTHVPSISIEEQLEISRMYAESLINKGKNGNKIAKVYCHMAGLVYPQNKRMDCSLCLSFYERAYEFIDEPTWMLSEIIGFCNKFGIDELRAKCKKKEDSFQSDKGISTEFR